jgi:hypothetical protein
MPDTKLFYKHAKFKVGGSDLISRLNQELLKGPVSASMRASKIIAFFTFFNRKIENYHF